MSDKPVNPVDALKFFGLQMDPEIERKLRAYCDQQVEMTKPPTLNEAIATGRVYIDHDPLRLLEDLRAQVSYAPHLGYVIALGKDHNDHWFKRLLDVIAFHRGGDTNLNKES